jgi:hypothetical protein
MHCLPDMPNLPNCQDLPKFPNVTADINDVAGGLNAGRRERHWKFPAVVPMFLARFEETVRGPMKLNLLSSRAWLLVLGCAAVCASSVGCQTTIGGQTLPSAYYLRDDLQYFPPGPEFKLTRQVQALEEYKLRQQGIGLEGEAAPGAVGAPPAPGMP